LKEKPLIVTARSLVYFVDCPNCTIMVVGDEFRHRSLQSEYLYKNQDFKKQTSYQYFQVAKILEDLCKQHSIKEY